MEDVKNKFFLPSELSDISQKIDKISVNRNCFLESIKPNPDKLEIFKGPG